MAVYKEFLLNCSGSPEDGAFLSTALSLTWRCVLINLQYWNGTLKLAWRRLISFVAMDSVDRGRLLIIAGLLVLIHSHEHNQPFDQLQGSEMSIPGSWSLDVGFSMVDSQ